MRLGTLVLYSMGVLMIGCTGRGDDVHIIPNLITYDEKGVYGCLDMYTISLFLSLVRSGQVNESLDRILELKNLIENSNPLIFYYPVKK